METYSIVQGYTRLKNDALGAYAQRVVLNTKENADFASMKDAVTNVEAANHELSAVMAEYDGGAKTKERLRIARESLIMFLSKLALLVEAKGREDVNFMLNSGFKLKQKRGATVTRMSDRPQSPKVKQDQKPGHIIVSVAKMPGVVAYEFEYAEIQDGAAPVWVRVLSASSRVRIANLVSGALYAFRVSTLDRESNLLSSDEVRSRVL